MAMPQSNTGYTRGWRHWPARWSADLNQIGRYGIVSVFALAVDFSVFLFFSYGLMQPALAAMIGYGVGLLVHYLCSLRWVFDIDRVGKSGPWLFIQFASSGFVGLGATGAIVTLCVDYWHWHPVLAKGAAVAVSFVLVFVLRRTVVFAPTSAVPK